MLRLKSAFWVFLCIAVIVLGQGAGFAAQVLGTPTHIPITSTNRGPTSVALTDINHDGDLDLVVTSACVSQPVSCTTGLISILLGNGNGTFKSPIDTVMANRFPSKVQVGDFNNDGIPDLIVLSPCYDGCEFWTIETVWAQVSLGNGDGTFHVLPSIPLGDGAPLGITVGDFNGDGRLDVATTSTCNYFWMVGCFLTGDFVWKAFGNGDGTFQPRLFLGPTGKYPNDLVAADFNSDGKTDLAVISSNHGNVNVLLGSGDGFFHLGHNFHTGPGVSLTAADVNGDGMLDLVVSAPPIVRIAYGNGDGTFQKPIGLSTAPENSMKGNQVITGDFNGDGRVDVAVVSYSLDALFVYVNRLNLGRFQKQFYSTPGGPARLAAGDLNKDGAEDIVILNFDSDDVAVFLSTGVAAASPSEPQ
jgi:hypothetical protein